MLGAHSVSFFFSVTRKIVSQTTDAQDQNAKLRADRSQYKNSQAKFKVFNSFPELNHATAWMTNMERFCLSFVGSVALVQRTYSPRIWFHFPSLLGKTLDQANTVSNMLAHHGDRQQKQQGVSQTQMAAEYTEDLRASCGPSTVLCTERRAIFSWGRGEPGRDVVLKQACLNFEQSLSPSCRRNSSCRLCQSNFC